MAVLIPSLNSCLGKMQTGEKRFARRLEQLLEDDYLCWYEIPVGKRQLYTDFIILHPGRGLLLLEIKDWKLQTIQRIDKQRVTLITQTGLKTGLNPLEQARQCAHQLVRKLERDPQLIHQHGNHQGKLVMPFGYGVVLSNITRKQFNATDLKEVLPTHKVICKDEMLESCEAEAFQQRLWDMFTYQFRKPLTLPQIDRVRWHIFPEIRINPPQQDLFANTTDTAQSTQDHEVSVPDIVKVMDQQQEQLARSMGNGHRVIHGVAGSGKTLILGYRSVHLAEILDKPILVLCYNITLATRLRQMMIDHGVEDRVNVYHFHEWCRELLRLFHIETPANTPHSYDRIVDKVIESVAAGIIPRGQYGAIMVDEGHDFKPEWLKLITGMVDPETDSLLLLYDDAQSIYNDKGKLDFSLSSVGIKARGRTTILRLNYRNTEEIIRFAYQFASRYLTPEESDDDHIPIIKPQSVGEHGSEPSITIHPNYNQEIFYLIHTFKKLHQQQQTPWSDMCVTYRNNWMGERIQRAFINAGIPSQWMGTASQKKNLRLHDNSIKIMTMHSSKGLEFPVVAVSGIGYLPDKHATTLEDAKLLYVAMTRSTGKLFLTSHRQNEFTAGMTEAV